MPKAMRDALGIQGGQELEITAADGQIVISPAPVPKRIVERDGRLVIVAEGDLAPLTAEQVRGVLDDVRR